MTHKHAILIRPEGSKEDYLPKCRLDAAHIILVPIPLRDLLLSNRDARPRNPHHRHIIPIVLIKANLLCGVVSRRPLIQSPALDDLRRLLQLLERTTDIPTKDLKLASHLRALEELRLRTSEGGDALRVGEGLVELCGRGAELLSVRDGRGVYEGALARSNGSRVSSLDFGLGARLRHVGGSAPSCRWVLVGGVLDILAVLRNQFWAELGE